MNKFEDSKGVEVITSRKSKMNRQCNGQHNKQRSTKALHGKLKIRQHNPTKTGDEHWYSRMVVNKRK